MKISRRDLVAGAIGAGGIGLGAYLLKPSSKLEGASTLAPSGHREGMLFAIWGESSRLVVICVVRHDATRAKQHEESHRRMIGDDAPAIENRA